MPTTAAGRTLVTRRGGSKGGGGRRRPTKVQRPASTAAPRRTRTIGLDELEAIEERAGAARAARIEAVLAQHPEWKVCPTCENAVPPEEWTPRGWCRACSRAYQREYMRRYRQKGPKP